MATRLESNAEPLPGYRLLERLGGGGFGEVWKCEAPGGLHKAIKFVYGTIDIGNNVPGTETGPGTLGEDDDDDWALAGTHEDGRQARQEYKALERVKRVRHPYILNIERYDIIDGQLLIVMELADRNLWDRFKECRAQGLPGIPRDELLGYLEEAAEALDLMNGEYQLQHLDIKPQNLFLVGSHIKVADFGLVKFLEGIETKVTGGITPVYASPETFDGIVSRHCDQYSLAICYQELLTGQRPFAGTSIRHLILQHIQAQPNVSMLPVADRAIVLRSLSKNPLERFPTCLELVRLLRQATGDPSSDTPTPGQRSGLENSLLSATSDSAVLTPAATAPMRRPSDSAQGMTQSLRNGELSVLRPSQEGAAVRAPAEIKGDGALFPSLVIGLGQLGMGVLQRLRERLVEAFGGLDAVPNLKLLLLDTDAEVMREATRGTTSTATPLTTGAALAAGEVMLAPLNRPSYYLKRREDRPSLETWINQRLLYRIPRSQVTTGVRALGRLAFCDNYRSVLRRLQFDLDSILEPAALRAAADRTGLGMRTNRPRIYLLTSLAGGTGSGMFLDLAYSLRALLRQHGYEQPDIVGVLLVPKKDGAQAGSMMLGNAFAALTELRYYATPGTVFTARYHERETPISDPEPPFSRTLILQLPDEADEAGTRGLQDEAGQMLFRDLCSPLGRTADLARAGLLSPAWPERGLYCQTFGLYRLSWPRRELLREVGRHLCCQLLARWMSKDSKPLAGAVATYIKERWRHHQLTPDSYIDLLQERLRQALRKDPETALLAIVEPLARQLRAQAATTPPAKRWGQPQAPAVEIEAEVLAPLLEEIERLVGKPSEDTLHDSVGQLGVLVRKVGEELAERWSQKLAEATVQLLEEPEYRLAGAEEAVRQVVALLDQVLQQYEPLLKDVHTRSENGHDALQKLLAGQGKQLNLTWDEAIELLRTYPKTRLQSLILQQVAQAFLSLRGHMSDQLREINYCRVRLGEIQRRLETTGPTLGSGNFRKDETSAPRSGAAVSLPPSSFAGRVLLPAGCPTMVEAVEELLGRIDAAKLLELDHQMEAMIRHHFQALVNVCMTNANILPDVERSMLETAGTFVGGFLTQTSVAEMFLDQASDPARRLAELAGYFAEAEPALDTGPFAHLDGRRSFHGEVPLRELRVLAHPPGPAGEELLRLARQALEGADIEGASSTEDVVFYREIINLHLAHLEQVGQAGLDAYRRMNATENFTAHTRTDVDYSTVVNRE